MANIPFSSSFSLKQPQNIGPRKVLFPEWYNDVTERNDWLVKLDTIISASGSGFTPFTVGPAGSGPNGTNPPYTSIQAAMTAANTVKTQVGNPQFGLQQIVYVKPGTYSENITTFYSGVHLIAFSNGAERSVIVNGATTGPSGGLNTSISTATAGGADIDIYISGITWASTAANAATATITHSGTAKVYWNECQFLHANTLAPLLLVSGAGTDSFQNCTGVVTGTPFSPAVNLTGSGLFQSFETSFNNLFDLGLNGSTTVQLLSSQFLGYILGTSTSNVVISNFSLNNIAGDATGANTLTTNTFQLLNGTVTSTTVFNVSASTIGFSGASFNTSATIQPVSAAASQTYNVVNSLFRGSLTITLGSVAGTRTSNATVNVNNTTVAVNFTVSAAAMTSGTVQLNANGCVFGQSAGSVSLSSHGASGLAAGTFATLFKSCTIGSSSSTTLTYAGSQLNTACTGANLLRLTGCDCVSQILYTPVLGTGAVKNDFAIDGGKIGALQATIVNQITVTGQTTPGALNVSINAASIYGTLSLTGQSGAGSGVFNVMITNSSISTSTLAVASTGITIIGGTNSALNVTISGIVLNANLGAVAAAVTGISISSGNSQVISISGSFVNVACGNAAATGVVILSSLGTIQTNIQNVSVNASSNGVAAIPVGINITQSAALSSIVTDISDCSVTVGNPAAVASTGISYNEFAGDSASIFNVNGTTVVVNSGSAGTSTGILYNGAVTGALTTSVNINQSSIQMSGSNSMNGFTYNCNLSTGTRANLVNINNSNINITSTAASTCNGINYVAAANTRNTTCIIGGCSISISSTLAATLSAIFQNVQNNPAGITVVNIFTVQNCNCVGSSPAGTIFGVTSLGTSSTTAASTNTVNISGCSILNSAVGGTDFSIYWRYSAPSAAPSTVNINGCNVSGTIAVDCASVATATMSCSIINCSASVALTFGTFSGANSNSFNIVGGSYNRFNYPDSANTLVNASGTYFSLGQGATAAGLTLPARQITFRANQCTFAMGDQTPLSVAVAGGLFANSAATAGSIIAFDQCAFRYITTAAAMTGAVIQLANATSTVTTYFRSCAISAQATNVTGLTASLVACTAAGTNKFDNTLMNVVCNVLAAPVLTASAGLNTFANCNISDRTTVASNTAGVVNLSGGTNTFTNTSIELDAGGFAASLSALIASVAFNMIGGYIRGTATSQTAVGSGLVNITGGTTGVMAHVVIDTSAMTAAGATNSIPINVGAGFTINLLSCTIMNNATSNITAGTGTVLRTSAAVPAAAATAANAASALPVIGRNAGGTATINGYATANAL